MALQEVGVWRPLRQARHEPRLDDDRLDRHRPRRSPHCFLFRAGGGFLQYGQYALERDPIGIGPIDYAPRSMSIMGISLAVITGVALFLLRARFGKAIRAVSDNPELASSSGIDSNRVILIVWVLSGALAGLGGVFYGLEYGIRWDMGFTLLLLMFAAIALGGLGSAFGAMAGAVSGRGRVCTFGCPTPTCSSSVTRHPDPGLDGSSARHARRQGTDRV